MGIIDKGILGGFSGKVGSVVGSKWRDKDVVRSRPRKRRKGSSTAGQLAHQAKFKLVAQLIKSLKDLFEISFQSYAKGQTGANAALAHVIKNAITGAFPDFQIAYDKVLVSRGSLLNAMDGKAAAGAKDTVQFTWTYTEGTVLGNAKADDLVLMVAYNAELNSAVYKIGAARSAGTDSLVIPGTTGKVMQTWISFITADKKDVATSIFSGEVTIA